MKDYKWLLFILLCCWIYKETFQEKIELQHCNNGITWKNASQLCEPGSLVHNVDILNTLNVEDDEDIWIGKALYRFPWLEILGCFHVPNIPSLIIETRGQCFGRCGTNYFGYQEETRNCICLQNVLSSNSTVDVTMCNDHRPHAYFLYKEYSKVIEQSSGGNCVTLLCVPQSNSVEVELKSRSCSGDISIATSCGKMINHWGLSYNDGLKSCISNNHLLLPPTYCYSIDSRIGIPYWSNIFRDDFGTNLTFHTKSTAESYDYTHNETSLTGMIVGITFGFLVVIGIVCGIVFYRLRLKAKLSSSHVTKIQENQVEYENTSSADVAYTPFFVQTNLENPYDKLRIPNVH